MQDILVIRFSSLGDLCVLGGSLARLASAPGGSGRRVTLVTKADFAPLMSRVRGVDSVISLPDSRISSLDQLAKELKSSPWGRIIDAHNTLRSHLLLGMMGRRPHTRLAKDTVARLAFMQFSRRSQSLERTMSDRFDDLFRDLSGDDESHSLPKGESKKVAFHAFASEAENTEPVLGMAPGAQWDTKQWPEEFFAEVLTRFRQTSSAPVRIFLGPREEHWFPGSRLEKTAAQLDGVRIYRGLSLVDLVEPLGGCSLLLTNDSGLLHLAEGAGTPVLAFFGPTVREFGYYPRLAGSRALEISLECRPCSRNGKRSCHRNDLACLTSITPDEVMEAVLTSREWNGQEARPTTSDADSKEIS